MADKDNKSVVEKTVDVVKEFAATVSDAARKAVESNLSASNDKVEMLPTARKDLMDHAGAPRKRGKLHKAPARTTRKAASKITRKAKSSSHRKPVAKGTSNSKKNKKSKR